MTTKSHGAHIWPHVRTIRTVARYAGALTVRQLLIAAAAAAVLTTLAIVTIDAPVARLFLARDLGALTPLLDRGLHQLDRVSGMNLPRGLLVTAAIVLGGATWWWRRDVGRALLLLGLTHAVARTFGSQLKDVFGRLRPAEALARGDLDHTFFADGISFPSGHVGHYAALAFVAACLWPRARIPAFVVLGLVVTARVTVGAHFVSDATGSIALAALATAGFAAALPATPRAAAALRG